VAVLGLGAALPSPSAPAVLQRRAVAFGSVQRAPRSQVVVPGGRGPGPPGANGYEPPPQDATPRSAFRIVSGDAPQMSEAANLIHQPQYVVNRKIQSVAKSLDLARSAAFDLGLLLIKRPGWSATLAADARAYSNSNRTPSGRFGMISMRFQAVGRCAGPAEVLCDISKTSSLHLTA
jgi:hypothetical protein